MKRPKPKYAGKGSATFWKRINAIKGVRHSLLYSAGVNLQNLEHVFHHAENLMELDLKEAELAKRNRPTDGDSK